MKRALDQGNGTAIVGLQHQAQPFHGFNQDVKRQATPANNNTTAGFGPIVGTDPITEQPKKEEISENPELSEENSKYNLCAKCDIRRSDIKLNCGHTFQ